MIIRIVSTEIIEGLLEQALETDLGGVLEVNRYVLNGSVEYFEIRGGPLPSAASTI